MENNTSYKTKRKLENMKKNMEKRRTEKSLKFPLNGIYIFKELIEKQNFSFLKKIADENILNPEERELFIEKYLKLNFHMPEIVSDHKKEEMQKYL
jgi:uncharacterized protein Smg (DUF494 family)